MKFLSLIQAFQKNIKDVLSEFKPDIVGISALTVEAENLYNLAEIFLMGYELTF